MHYEGGGCTATTFVTKLLWLAGMTSLLPDFLMLCVCARSGVQQTSREHLAAALALDIPVFCVFTKTDSVHPAVLARVLRATRQMLASATDSVAAASSHIRGASTDDQSERSVQASRGWRQASNGDVDGRLMEVPESEVFRTDDDDEMSAKWQEHVCSAAPLLGLRFWMVLGCMTRECCNASWLHCFIGSSF
jgi:hypothetical protein